MRCVFVFENLEFIFSWVRWDLNVVLLLVLIEFWTVDCCVGGLENVFFRVMEG